MNSLDQLIRQSNILLEIVEINRKSAKKERSFENWVRFFIKKTLNVSKSFMENYNEFLTNQIEIDKLSNKFLTDISTI